MDAAQKRKIAADLIALAAQEGNNGEDWDLVQEAGFLIREQEAQIAQNLATIDGLLQLINYVVGIAERGVGRKIRDDEAVGLFVLSYVQSLEKSLSEGKPTFTDELVKSMDDIELLRMIDFLEDRQLRLAMVKVQQKSEELRRQVQHLEDELDDSGCDDCDYKEGELAAARRRIDELETLLAKHGIEEDEHVP